MKKTNVTKVIDGDTFKDSSGKFNRLAGIDTPEKGEKGYIKAKEMLRRKVEGKTVYVKKVGVSYGRPVVEARVKGQKGSINNSLKRAGFGA
ncbi:thermonuclease family protein [Patescibacteria group bacterium]